MVAVSASLAAWLFPTFGVLKKGFENPSRLDPNSVVVLACWYLLIFTSFFLGQKIAGLWAFSCGYKPTSRLLDLESNAIYLGFTLISALGLGAMVSTIVRNMSLAQMILFISLGQSNALKETVYEDYRIGIVSLRYVVLYPASVALYRMIRLRKYSLLNIFNVLMLAVCTFVSFRLIFNRGARHNISLSYVRQRIGQAQRRKARFNRRQPLSNPVCVEFLSQRRLL